MPEVSVGQSNKYRANAPLSRPALMRRWLRQQRRRQEIQKKLEVASQENQRLHKDIHSLNGQVASVIEEFRLFQATCDGEVKNHLLDDDRPLMGHQFGVRLIALCIELAKRVGFRATQFVVETVFTALGIDQKVPSHDVIEQWTLRLGVAELGDTFSKDQRVLWMADHSSQIGKEKVLLILGVALDNLPPPGETLQFEHIKVLAIIPGQKWKKEDVAREYQKLAEQIGAPAYLLCDGAVELRDPAEKLEIDGQKPVVLGDLKHHAANLLEKEIGRSERFQSFLTAVGLTRNRVQQTELSHFTPPPLRQKSRFMNIGPLLGWSQMVLHHLDHPEGKARQGVSDERMEEKLGWLRSFADELSQWSDCQEVIDQSLKVINVEGFDSETPQSLRVVIHRHLADPKSCSTPASRLANKLLDWVGQSASLLRPGDRVWLSTEILESLFGRFKRLERQHSKGGFTRLIAALPTLCRTVDASLVRRRFKEVNAKALKSWIRDKLAQTLTARRNLAYHESRTENRDHVFSPA